jgi:hypothetical protein
MTLRGRPQKSKQFIANIEEEIQPPTPPQVQEEKIRDAPENYDPPEPLSQRMIPETDLELNYMVTTPKWGDSSHNPELERLFSKTTLHTVPKDEVYADPRTGQSFISDGTARTVTKKNEWSNLAIFGTGDIRLSNFNDDQTEIVLYWGDLASDINEMGMQTAALLCVGRIANMSEVTQGHKGFLRKALNTLIKEEKSTYSEMKKPSILGGRNKEEI